MAGEEGLLARDPVPRHHAHGGLARADGVDEPERWTMWEPRDEGVGVGKGHRVCFERVKPAVTTG